MILCTEAKLHRTVCTFLHLPSHARVKSVDSNLTSHTNDYHTTIWYKSERKGRTKMEGNKKTQPHPYIFVKFINTREHQNMILKLPKSKDAH